MDDNDGRHALHALLDVAYRAIEGAGRLAVALGWDGTASDLSEQEEQLENLRSRAELPD